jgi:hypothetical protein
MESPYIFVVRGKQPSLYKMIRSFFPFPSLFLILMGVSRENVLEILGNSVPRVYLCPAENLAGIA